jgi:hypothetical protein
LGVAFFPAIFEVKLNCEIGLLGQLEDDRQSMINSEYQDSSTSKKAPAKVFCGGIGVESN